VWPGKPRMWCWPMPFGINAASNCHDTHVRRLSNPASALSNRASRAAIEPELMKLLPQPEWENFRSDDLSTAAPSANARKTTLRRLAPSPTLCPAIPSRPRGRLIHP